MPTSTSFDADDIKVLGDLQVRRPPHLARDEAQEIRIALAQLLPSSSPSDDDEAGTNIEAGLRKLEKYARRAKQCGADVVVYPEYFLTGALHSDWTDVRSSRSPLGVHAATHAEEAEDSEHFLKTVSSLAKELGIDICAGTAVELGTHQLQHRKDSEQGETDERLFNTAYYVDRTGVVKGKYTKRNLWHPERTLLSPATDDTHPAPRVFDIDNGRGRSLRASMLICWDLAFPEEFRALMDLPEGDEQAMRGPDIIFMPTCWYATDAGPRGLRWNAQGEGALLDAFTLTRAIENECIVALSNVSGPSPSSSNLSSYLSNDADDIDAEPPLIGLGHSSISAPFLGCVAKAGGEEEALLLGAVDLRVLQDARETYRIRKDLALSRKSERSPALLEPSERGRRRLLDDTTIWATDVSGFYDSLASSPSSSSSATAGQGTMSSSSRASLEALVASFLPASERQEVLRFVRPVDRVRALVGKLLRRLAVVETAEQLRGEEEGGKGGERGEAWRGARFAKTREGRPYLVEPDLSSLDFDFNLTHDGDWVVLAFRSVPSSRVSGGSLSRSSVSPSPPPKTTTRRLGVDVMELTLPHFESSSLSFLETMGESVTPDEKRWILDVVPPPQPEAAPSNSSGSSSSATPSSAEREREVERERLARIFDLWTHKEAYTKALGLGLGFDFKDVELRLWKRRPAASVGSVERRKDEEEEEDDRVRAALRRARRVGSGILGVKGESSGHEAWRFVELLLPPGAIHGAVAGGRGEGWGKGQRGARGKEPGAGQGGISQLVISLAPPPSTSALSEASTSYAAQQINPALPFLEAARSYEGVRLWSAAELVKECLSIAGEQHRR